MNDPMREIGPVTETGFNDRAEGYVIKRDPLWNPSPYPNGPETHILRGEKARIHIAGRHEVECYDQYGVLKWKDIADNALNNTSINNMLDVYLFNQTQTATWYMALVDNTGFSAFALTDTAASHAGWTEFTLYSAANRPAWGNGAASSQSMTNASQVSYSINGSGTVKGLCLFSNNTKGGTTGILYSTAAFSGGNQTVANLDTLRCTYTVTGTTS